MVLLLRVEHRAVLQPEQFRDMTPGRVLKVQVAQKERIPEGTAGRVGRSPTHP